MSERRVVIEKLVAGGDGLARLDSRVVFVPMSLPGEELDVLLHPASRGRSRGEIVSIVRPARERVDAPCAQFGPCGGCQWQHAAYDAQLTFKRDILRETLSRIGNVHVRDMPPVSPSPDPLEYRHTVRFHVHRGRHGFELGFYQRETHQPIASSDCLLVHPSLQAVIRAVSEMLQGCVSLPMRVETLEFRISATTDDVLCVGRGTYRRADAVRAFLEQLLQIPKIIGCVMAPSRGMSERVSRSTIIAGKDSFLVGFQGLTLSVGWDSFLQTNWPVYERMGQVLLSWVGDPAGLCVLELYAGIGALGMSLAQRGAFVTMVEGHQGAVEDARRSVALSRVSRCRIRHQLVEEHVPAVHSGAYDLVVLDPPRGGMHARVAEALGRIGAARMIYISCDGATFARDAARLRSHGYVVRRIQPFDMFPQTAHVEMMAEFEKAASGDET